MNTLTKQSLASFIEPAMVYVEDAQLKNALLRALENRQEETAIIEGAFEKFGSMKWSEDSFKLFFNAWKDTHLKMLAIYGLSCRMQRIALESDDQNRVSNLLLAAAKNAETSYEDLGLDFDGSTHTELYHDLAESFVSDDSWMLSANSLPEAKAFKNYVYRNMVVAEDIQTGLFTNMFSEIYNHAEYSVALVAFNQLIEDNYDWSEEKKRVATTYVHAHIEDETELNHFTVVIDSLNAYCKGMNTTINYELAQQTFETYLSKLSTVFQTLSARLSQ